jgi:hypothetical protein
MPQNQLKLSGTQPLVDENGLPEQAFREWALRVSNDMVLVGTGTPEGVITAAQYTLYVDETDPAIPVSYRKMLPEIGGDRSQGWAVV